MHWTKDNKKPNQKKTYQLSMRITELSAYKMWITKENTQKCYIKEAFIIQIKEDS